VRAATILAASAGCRAANRGTAQAFAEESLIALLHYPATQLKAAKEIVREARLEHLAAHLGLAASDDL
jgi:hypothetical protein